MKGIVFGLLSLLLLPSMGCGKAELASIHEVTANQDAFMDENVRLKGVHVPRERTMEFVSIGRLDYLALEDETGRIKVWYDKTARRCPPRLEAELTVTGKVVASGDDARLLFMARSISIDEEPALADNEVRLCQLSLQEQQIHAEEGPEGMREYWRSEGKGERVLVYD